MQVVDGRRYWEIPRREFWDSVAFYNYVQEPVATSAGVAPTPAMYRQSDIAFSAVISDLAPTHILVVSRRLWESMVQSENANTTELAGQVRDIRTYQQSLATWIPHPSRFFSVKKWHPIVRAYLGLTPNTAFQGRLNFDVDFMVLKCQMYSLVTQ